MFNVKSNTGQFQHISGQRGVRIERGPNPAKVKPVYVKGMAYHGFEVDGKLYVNLARAVGRFGDCLMY